MDRYEFLKQTDPEVYKAIMGESKRQFDGVELIASENYVSESVLDALGSILTNKYSEGMVGKRYYGGNKFIDDVESLAVDRAKQLYGVDHVNVQPYSGSPANLAVYFALLEPGNKVMGMNLYFGGHLTHGWGVNITGKYFESVQYQTGRDGLLDYDELEKQVKKERPKLLICGATAYPRVYDYKRLAEIAHSVDAYFMADIAHESGLIAAGVIPSPVGHADVITSTTHKTLRGPRGGMIMCNGNPSEPLKPLAKDADPRQNLPTLIDRAIFPGLQGGPHNHTTAGIAVALGEAMKPEFKVYAQQIVDNAHTLAKAMIERGYELVSGGTDNHLMLINMVASKGISGKEAEEVLEEVGITVNKNTVPWDERKPYDPSGIRLGTPAITTRGLVEDNMGDIAGFIDSAIDNRGNKEVLAQIKSEVTEYMAEFKIPGIEGNE